jgi:hypothetical protein
MEAMMNTSTLIGVGAVLTVALLGQSWLLWRLTRSLGGVQKLDEKLGHYGDALSLLTETTESGFKAVAAELDRTAARPNDGPAKAAIKKAMPGPSTAARISAAARRGRTVPEIAAAEELSEGEVRLRLHMAKQTQANTAATKAAAATKTTTVTATRRTTRTNAVASKVNDSAPKSSVIAAKTSVIATKTNVIAAKQEQTNGTVRA